MDKSCQSLRKARKGYWMMELRRMYPYDLNVKYGDEYITENAHTNMTKTFSPLPSKSS